MSSENERLDITMRIIGARQAEKESERVGKGVKGVGSAATWTGTATLKTNKATSALTKSYGALGKAARYGIGFLGVGGVFALEQAVTNTEELSKTTTGLNRNMGLSIQTGSDWAAVAHARGIATTALNMSFTKMGKTFVEANRKGGTARTALNQLGITQNETTKGAHDFNYALGLVSKKFGEAHAGPKRQSAAMALLGKGYSTVLPLFSQGNKGLQEQLHWAEEYGVTLSGKTNSAIMEMVEAQRENKVAMLGLQVSLTKALMPAIKAGDDQLQTFIKTLNDPKMSGAEKITAIQHQFEGIENTLLKVISKALPKVAEAGGALGVKLAEAVWIGFKNSNLVGKLVISAWLFKFMGGGGLIKSVAGGAGKAIAQGLFAALFPRLAEEFAVTGSLSLMLDARFGEMGKFSGLAFTTAFLLATVGIGFLLAEQVDKTTHGAFRQWGINAGQNFVNALIWVINKGIGLINGVLNDANAFAILGVEAPQIGEVGKVNWHAGEESTPTQPKAPHIRGLPHADPTHPNNPFGIGNGKHQQTPRRQTGRSNKADFIPRPQHIHLHWNSREIASGVLLAGEDAMALR